MVQMTPAPPSAPVFCIKDKRGELRPLTYPVISAQFKDWVAKVGFNSSNYTMHSLRRGGASWASKKDIPTHFIKVLGNWASEAYLRYISTDAEVKLTAQRHFKNSMFDDV